MTLQVHKTLSDKALFYHSHSSKAEEKTMVKNASNNGMYVGFFMLECFSLISSMLINCLYQVLNIQHICSV